MENTNGASRIYGAIAVVAALCIPLVIFVLLQNGTFSASKPAQGAATVQQSANLLNADEYAGAISSADAVIAKDPTNIQALLLKAEALAQEGSLTFHESEYGAQAIALAQQALALDPKSDEAWRIIGYSYEIMQNYAAAHAAYGKAIALNPNNAAAISENAHAFDLEGNFTEAGAGYRQALAIDPSFDQALIGTGRLALRAGDLDLALARFAAVATSSPNIHTRAEGAYSAGLIEDARGMNAEAERSMRQALANDPAYALGWTGLSKVLFDAATASSSPLSLAARNQNITESFSDLQKAIAINPNQAAAHFELGMQLAVAGRTPDALIVFRGLLSIVPKDITLSAPDKQTMLTETSALIAQLTTSPITR